MVGSGGDQTKFVQASQLKVVEIFALFLLNYYVCLLWLLRDWFQAYDLWKEGKDMEFADPSVDDTYSPCKLLRCMQIALLCVQEDANDRPSMLEISSMMRNDTILAIPKKPAFSREQDLQEPNKQETSVNEVTISQLVAR